MKPVLEFIKTTFVGGILFLIPLVLVLVLLQKAIEILEKLLAPIAHHLPGFTMVGISFPQLVAVLILLVIGFFAGLIAKMGIGARLVDRIESVVLRKVPGFTLLKSMAHGKLGGSSDRPVRVALANIDDAWLIAFIMEEEADGLLTVFVPSAPTPTAGSLYFLTEQQVKRLDVPMQTAIKCIMQLGVGARELLASSSGRPPASKGVI